MRSTDPRLTTGTTTNIGRTPQTHPPSCGRESDLGLPAHPRRTASSVDPAPKLSAVTWSQFLHSQAGVACDFFSVDTALLRRYYVLFFIHIPSRQVFYAGVTANPTGAWTTQAARNLFLHHGNKLAASRALVRYRGSQFIDATSYNGHRPQLNDDDRTLLGAIAQALPRPQRLGWLVTPDTLPR